MLIDFTVPGDDLPAPTAAVGYTTVSGTSGSTALLAGIVALIRQKRPHLTPPQIYEVLKSTATDKGPPGHDSQYGWGVVDPVKALTAPDPVPEAGPTLPPAFTPPPVERPSFWRTDNLVPLTVAVLVWGGGLALVVTLVVLVRRRVRR